MNENSIKEELEILNKKKFMEIKFISETPRSPS